MCKEAFTENDDIAVCPICGTPHHRACYKKENVCANAERHSEDFSWKPNGQAEGKAEQKTERRSETGDEVLCPVCREANPKDAEKCARCGFPLSEEPKEMPPLPRDITPKQAWNMLPPRFRGHAIEADDPIGTGTALEAAEYVRIGSANYVTKFYAMESGGKKVTWNWAAFFFAPYWFFYRKMSGIGAALAAILLLSTALFTNAGTFKQMDAMNSFYMRVQSGEVQQSEIQAEAEKVMNASGNPLWYDIAPSVISFGVAVFSGLFANRFYFKKLKRELPAFRAEKEAMGSGLRVLLRKGGTSILAASSSYVIYYTLGSILYSILERFVL